MWAQIKHAAGWAVAIIIGTLALTFTLYMLLGSMLGLDKPLALTNAIYLVTAISV